MKYRIKTTKLSKSGAEYLPQVKILLFWVPIGYRGIVDFEAIPCHTKDAATNRINDHSCRGKKESKSFIYL